MARDGVLTTRTPLWFAFVAVHLLVGGLALFAPNLPLGDVTIAYLRWVREGFATGEWVGIDLPWVYPYPALIPMVLSAVAGLRLYAVTWLVIVLLLNAAALAVLTGVRERRHVAAGWWWVAFTALLGPIAVARIDAVSVAMAIPAVVVLATHPRLATALLTIAAWIKIWPAAIVIALVAASRRRGRIFLAALVTSVTILLIGLILGGTTSLGFLTVQGVRGIQVESVIGTAWMWRAALPGSDTSVAYDPVILTYQLYGPGLDAVAALATPLMVVAAGAAALLGVRAVRRGGNAAGNSVESAVVPPLMLALVMVFIVLNKVGSPQIMSWVAVPVIAGLVASRHSRDSFALPAAGALLIAGTTQLIYPYLYNHLLGLDPALLVVLSLRNATCVALLVWALVRLGRLGAVRPVPASPAPDSTAPVERIPS
ncbi:MAG: glycosyltransferase 87 family protein [Microbacteriaceae bacterium]